MVLPLEGRRPPLAVFLVLETLFVGAAVLLWLRHGPSVNDPTRVLASAISLGELALAALVVIITVAGRWSRAVGWFPRRGSDPAVPRIAVAVCAVSAVTILTAGADLAWGPSAYVVLLVNCLAVGVFEETMYRGLLWASLPERWSASRVLLVTSLVFGATHLTNGFATGRWGTAIGQACIVSVTGLGLGAIRMRSGWLGLGVLTHAMVDAALAAGGISLARSLASSPDGRHVPGLVLLSELGVFAMYVVLGVAGIAVLVRTFRSERQLREMATWPPPGPWPPPSPPTLDV